LEQEDLRWKQRAKQNWYKNGDRNTQYFHAWANQCRRTSQEWQKHSNIPNVFLEHYQELFTMGGTRGLEDCLAGMENHITTEMNQVLGCAFTEMEVDEALK
jgi:lipoate-protein ligase B